MSTDRQMEIDYFITFRDRDNRNRDRGRGQGEQENKHRDRDGNNRVYIKKKQQLFRYT